MRLSEFRRAIADEFGDDYGRVVTNDLVVASLGDRTAEQALSAGVSPKDVWLALCQVTGVPPTRRYGVGLPAPKD
ncbi:DUF3046 domain-containing protein [Compostimonas suwonensis]|uniref:DUF3046 family protein n=1 Tax=Compostimonas suwonensis TaxID=1048394 RepID=A0A2M9BTQ3_9MICO|nr:DUF3046 domain-containing protein [Compostimonas suwonensis]PJJ61339.1 Protein of unknown function (DUF3046) [Compostimonas suwonensis]